MNNDVFEITVPAPRLEFQYHRGRGKYVTRFESDTWRSRFYIVVPELVVENGEGVRSLPWYGVNVIVRDHYALITPASRYDGGGEAVILLKLGYIGRPKTYLVEHYVEPFDRIIGDHIYLFLYKVPITASDFPLAKVNFTEDYDDDGRDKIVYVKSISPEGVLYELVEPGIGF